MNQINLKEYLSGKVVFLGVGNSLRGDDGAGCKFIEKLEKSETSSSCQIYTFKGERTPENYLEPILRIDPDFIFVVDAVDFGADAGAIRLFQQIPSQSTFSTHTLSLQFIFDYLKKRTRAQILILGIQPASTEWGSSLSEEVRESVEKLIEGLISD